MSKNNQNFWRCPNCSLYKSENKFSDIYKWNRKICNECTKDYWTCPDCSKKKPKNYFQQYICIYGRSVCTTCIEDRYFNDRRRNNNN